ncbi:MAG: type II secretion system F family protein [Bacteroidetes bacterium]|nr:type II secretion system F family protein [Bacteroidota bacterium]
MSSIDLQKLKTTSRAKKAPASKLNFDFLNKDISLFGNALGDKNKERFFSELGLLLSEGIDIKTAIELASEDSEQGKFKDKYLVIRNDILNGARLSEALKKSEIFSSYDYHNIAIGEETGRLSIVLRELALYYAQKMKWQRMLMGAISYPAVVILVSFVAVFFMMDFIVPMFNEVFKRFKGELPWITRFIIHISAIVTHFAGAFIVLVIGVAILAVTQKRKPWFRKYMAEITQRIPIVGPLLVRIYMARFCHTMALLLDSQVSIITSLELMESMIGFYPLEVSLPDIKEKVIHGVPFHEALAAHPIYSPKMIKMLRIGEEVNRMNEMFKKVAIKYTEESEHQIELMNKLIEPFLIVFLGVVVSVILIAMYLPLFKLSSQIG